MPGKSDKRRTRYKWQIAVVVLAVVGLVCMAELDPGLSVYCLASLESAIPSGLLVLFPTIGNLKIWANDKAFSQLKKCDSSDNGLLPVLKKLSQAMAQETPGLKQWHSVPLKERYLLVEKRILGILEQTQGSRSPELLERLKGRAIYAYTQQWPEADTFFAEALAKIQQVYGQEDPHLTDLVAAALRYHVGQHDDRRAEPLYRLIINIKEKASGASDPDLVDYLNGLALLDERSGNKREAAQLKQQVNDISSRAFGDLARDKSK